MFMIMTTKSQAATSPTMMMIIMKSKSHTQKHTNTQNCHHQHRWRWQSYFKQSALVGHHHNALFLLLFLYIHGIVSSASSMVAAASATSSSSSSSSSSSPSSLDSTQQQAVHALGIHIVRAPESAVAPKGDEVVFECELNLAPHRLEWRFRPSIPQQYSSSSSSPAAAAGALASSPTSSSSSSQLRYRYLPEINNITTEERLSKLRIYVVPETLGDYQCVAWYGPTAIASTSARLTLVSISIDNSNGYSRNAIRWSVAPKNCILIRCGTVTSNPPAVWSFYRNGEKVPQTEVLPTSSGGALILNSVSAKDSGNYTCAAMNAITGVELKLPQIIDVRVDYSERTPPHFLVQRPPTQAAARPGETIVLECPGVGSPKPEAVWSSPNIENIYNNRTKILPYGLQIVDVRPEDQGSYVCRLDNGIAPVLVHMIMLNVLERPRILHGPIATLTNEGDSLELKCTTSGNPAPDIFWLINGDDIREDNETHTDERRLIIRHVQKRHAGIVQCFAKNIIGETSEANLLKVNPKQIQGEVGNMPLGNVPIRQPYEHSYGNGGGSGNGGSNSGNGKGNKGKRKHMRVANMVPPSRPNVTRLSDDSVMLRWNVPKNDGLPIQFFKVQYRMLGDSARKKPRENWQTTNEDIPYGKRERNNGNGDNSGNNGNIKNFTSSVTGLKPDRNYRFRIIAVYSNNDNKEGNTSIKFFLQRGTALGLAKANLPVPEIEEIEALSESAVLLHWSLLQWGTGDTEMGMESNQFDGFYAYYRPSSSAGEYQKATVDGMHTRHFKIDMLETGTAYEFKLQSFNAHAASEFSGIKQGRTKKPHTTPTPTAPAFIPTTHANHEDNSIYPVIAGAAGGGLLLLIAAIGVCLCMKRRKQTQNEEDKPQLDHIQADFVTSAVLGVTPHHKAPPSGAGAGHRLNGVIPRMNITANPLAQDGSSGAGADKNRNVMEMRFMPPPNQGNNPPISTTSSSSLTTTTTTTTTKPEASATTTTTTALDHEDFSAAGELVNGKLSLVQHQTQRSSSSCETLEASDGVVNNTKSGVPTTTTTTTTTMATSTTLSTVATQLGVMTNGGHSKTSSLNSLEQVSPLSKPLPPLPTKHQQQHHHQQQHQHQHHAIANKTQQQQQQQQSNTSAMHQQQQQQQHHQQQQQHRSGLHHAQPYQQPPTPTAGTPTMLHKTREYNHHHQQQQQQQHPHQQPPPVPPHQNQHHMNNNNNHNNNNNNINPSLHHFTHLQHNQMHTPHHHQQQQQHHHQQQQQQQHTSLYHQAVQSPQTPSSQQLAMGASSPTFDQQRRTLERSMRNLQQQQQHYTPTDSPNMDGSNGLPTRIPSLRRTRRTSHTQHNGNAAISPGHNINGGVGIPIIVPGSPRVQRSPMPARAMIKRTRLGSHADNISSGSLNSIEV